MRLPDIAHQLTVWTQSESETEFVQRQLVVYNALYHDHLPELEEANIVTYHQQTDEVELGSAAEEIRSTIINKLQSEITDLLEAEQTGTRALIPYER